MIELLFLLVISLLVRLYPVRNNVPDFDTYGHLYYAYEVKSQKASPWGSIRIKCWQSENFKHPFFWHWLISCFSIKRVLNHQKWVNGSIDALFSVFIYILLINSEMDQQNSLLGFFLYLFTPMWFSSISIGPRVDALTPRLFSEILLNLIFVVLLLDIGLSQNGKIILATGFAFVTLISSKFGAQALFFLSPLVALFTQSVIPLLSVLGSVILAFIFSRGEVISMLNRQLHHLISYYRNNRNGKMAISDRNNFLKLFKMSWYRIIFGLISYNSYISVIIKMPIYIATLIFALMIIFLSEEHLDIVVFAPVAAASVLYLLVNRPLLLFLGEAERYLNHIAIFILISGVSLAQQLNLTWILWGIVIYGIIFWVVEVFIYNRISPKIQRKKTDDTIEKYLNKYNKNRLIFLYPYHSVGVYRIMLNTPHYVIFPYHMEKSIQEKFTKHFVSDYPYMRLEKFNNIVRKINVNTLIIDKKSALERGFGNWAPPKGWKKLDLKQSTYDIYELEQ